MGPKASIAEREEWGLESKAGEQRAERRPSKN